MKRSLFIISTLAVAALAGCREDEQSSTNQPIRPIKTHLVELSPISEIRTFPSVLEPSELTNLSFEIGGTLDELDLAVGQQVKKGELISSLNPASLEIQLQDAQAGVRQAEAEHNSAVRALKRNRTLLSRGAITQVAVDEAETQELATMAQLDQARQAVASAKDNLVKASIIAPYDGVVNSVDATSFVTVSAGTPIASIYEDGKFEVSISAGYAVAAKLDVGYPARIRLADRPDLVLDATVKELGQRADLVSSFPVYLSVDDEQNEIRAGMAAEVVLELPLTQPEGFLVPLSSIATNQGGFEIDDTGFSEELFVFVYDPESETVQQRRVSTVTSKGDLVVVTEGLEPGDQIASAGVSFLKDGQRVRLLTIEDES